MFKNIGALAQLGERLLCKQEVAGSSPAGSTNLNSFSRKIPLNLPTFKKSTLYQNLINKSCKLPSGEIVQDGFSGNDFGNNYCDCTNGRYTCTEMAFKKELGFQSKFLTK